MATRRQPGPSRARARRAMRAFRRSLAQFDRPPESTLRSPDSSIGPRQYRALYVVRSETIVKLGITGNVSARLCHRSPRLVPDARTAQRATVTHVGTETDPTCFGTIGRTGFSQDPSVAAIPTPDPRGCRPVGAATPALRPVSFCSGLRRVACLGLCTLRRSPWGRMAHSLEGQTRPRNVCVIGDKPSAGGPD